MFVVKFALFCLMISCISAESENTNYIKLLEVKTRDKSIVNGKAPIYGVFNYNHITNETSINFYIFKIILSDHGIKEIQRGAFRNVGGRPTINLQRNKLKNITKGIFNNVDVGDINLNDNEISFVEDGAFDNIPSLQAISLSNNRLKFWNNNWFANTPQLVWFWFKNNSIQELPVDSFKNMREIKLIGGDEYGLNLIFDHNQIKTIHQTAFKGIHTLEILSLENNSIENFPDKLLEGVIVNYLNLRENNLKCIPKSAGYTEKTLLSPRSCI